MTGTYTSAGARLSYQESGSGLAVVFLHPTPLNRRFWQPAVEQIPGVHAIAPDLRGHGASELGSELPVGLFSQVADAPVLTMSQLAADVLALLDHLKLAEAVFVGCSIGGYALLELWRQAPHRMRGLAFVCSKPQADSQPALARRAENISKARSEGAESLFDAMTKALLGKSAQQRRPEIHAEVRAQMNVTTEAFVAIQAGLAARPDSVPTVAAIQSPVLAIAGGEDTSVSPAEMEMLRQAPGGCQFHLLEDAGHFAAYEQPDRVAAILQSWLQQFRA